MTIGSLIILAVLLAQSAQPYFDFSKAGAGFFGAGEDEAELAHLDAIRIGVLGPSSGTQEVQLRTGIALALEEINARGGHRGLPFEIVYRADDGPWGVAANQVVRLAYEDRVRAIIGGVDGQKTHLAELVVSKAWVPVLSPTAPDSSVDYANVPWVFRCAPSDASQADALLDYATRRGWHRLVVLSEAERESYTGFQRLRERMERRHEPPVAHLQYTAGGIESVARRLLEFRFDAIVVWGRTESASSLIEAIRRTGERRPVLVPSAVAEPSLGAKAAALGEVVGAAACDLSFDAAERRAFRRRFVQQAGEEPSVLSLYAYDATRLLAQAIDSAGPGRAAIRNALTRTVFDGITGTIRFDSLRGNPAVPVLLILARDGWRRLPG